MEMQPDNGIIKFLEHSSILVTGVTGFLAKVFVEKVLRVQPNIRNIYCLIRAPDAKSAFERFQNEVIGKHLFTTLKENLGDDFSSFIMDKVTLVPGDIAFENFRVTDTNLLEEMLRNVNIVVNVAATTNFDERYDTSLRINTIGAMNILNFAKKCVNIKILLQVSTAYVAGEAKGLILERPCDMGSDTLNEVIVDIENEVMEKRLFELEKQGATEAEITIAMKDLGAQRAQKYGWPNAYVFTKAMGEVMIGLMKENIRLVIIRPTVITSTYKEPFPGWTEGLRTVDSIAFGYGKGKFTFFIGDPETITDMIPADMVVNAMLVAMEAHANLQYDRYIYHIGSSVANPIRNTSIRKCIYSYFMNNPLIGKDGKTIIVGKATFLPSMATFYRCMAIRYVYPLKVLEFVNAVLCNYFQDTCEDLNRKLSFTMHLAELYRPYMFFKGIFDDSNTEELRREASKNEKESEMFNFDRRIINWDDYLVNTQFPGVIKHVIKK